MHKNFRTGARLKKSMTLTILKYDSEEDSYHVIDSDGVQLEVEAAALHDDGWIEQADA